jgi:hypothetical protein
MITANADRNRPLHLARRDIFFERAIDLIGLPLESVPHEARALHVSHILSAFQHARLHAFFASRSGKATNRENDFLRFLDLKLNNVRSVDAMIQHQMELAEEEGFLCRFLDESPDQFALPALHYQRCAEDILLGLWHIISLAQAPYLSLRQDNWEAMTPEEQGRYQRAHQSAAVEAATEFPSTILLSCDAG